MLLPRLESGYTNYGMLSDLPTRLLGNVRPGLYRRMHGTELAHAFAVKDSFLRSCCAMPGTDLAYGATRASGTDLAYGGTRAVCCG
eukprot:2813835-Rhodomonas_salina.5